MPKQLDYPRASLKAALQLAKAIDDLGGTCSADLAADKLGKRVSGAFQALIGSSAKYGLISNKGGKLSVEKLYRDYKLAYNEQERGVFAQKALLSIPLFQKIYTQFQDTKLPIDHFEKYLIRELQVPEVIASRVATYFVEGAKLTGLMNSDYSFSKRSIETPKDTEVELANETDSGGEDSSPLEESPPGAIFGVSTVGAYAVRIQGPGIDSMIEISGEDDLLIVQAMLKKIEKLLREKFESTRGLEG